MVNPGQQVQTLTMLRCGEVVVTRGVCGGGGYRGLDTQLLWWVWYGTKLSIV